MRHNRFEILSPSVLQLVKTVQSIKSRKMAEYGLKGTNALCLCEILNSGEEGLSATELARCCEIDKAQVSRCMADMMQRGFVNPTDRVVRRYKQKYTLTEEGTAVAADVHQCMTEIRAALNKDITERELEEFYRVLYKLCENFSELLAAQKDEDN